MVRPYQAYKESKVEWLGRVPADWGVRRIKDSVQEAKNGVWGEEPDNGIDDFWCVRVADFDRPLLSVAKTDRTIRKVLPNERVGRQLQRGDLLLEKSGGGEKSPVGFVVLFDHDDKAVCSNFVSRVRLAKGMIPKYWTYLHATTYSLRLTQRSIKQTSGIQNLDQSNYFNELAPFPPVQEQQQIADYLDAHTAKIDVLIEKQERLIETLAERRQAVISHAVTKGIDPNVELKDSGVRWLGEAPSSWPIVKVGYAFSVTVGKMLNSGKIPDEGEVAPYLRAANIQPDGLDLGDVKHMIVSVGERRALDLRQSDVVVVEGGGGYGRSDVLTDDLPGWVFQNHVLRVRPRREDSSDFFNYLMKTINSNGHVASLSNHATIPSISSEKLASVRFGLPEICVQVSIVAHLDRETAQIDALAAKAREMIDVLKERRQALISAAVTGKIDVRGLS